MDRRGVQAARSAARQRDQPQARDGIPGAAGGGADVVKSTTIARNYAEALLLAAEAQDGKGGSVEQYGRLMDAVAGALEADERIAVALDSPRVAKATKAALLERALADVTPPEFVRFLQAVVRRGRQGLLGEIAQQYQALVDAKLDRVHAGVVLVEEPDARLEKQIVERLTAALGKDVRAHFRADRGIIGGVVVRVGDRVYDGSLKRRLAVLRRKMLTGE
ncbi:MAG: ATP synthase F1 subunit delta [Gemmatimonadetes bacterium]|nr:MAG: ATP synthase F1 subunit delta [Gemmatimonadota bacterium]